MNEALLRVASRIVPRQAREEWLAEWRGELAFIQESDPASARGFCLGAFPDALYVRRHSHAVRTPFLASPVHCLAALAVLVIAGAFCRPTSVPLEQVVFVRSHGRPVMVTYEQYRRIAANLPTGFEAVAFYRKGPADVVATRTMDAVLRGAEFPDGGRSYRVVDDPGPGAGHVLARLRREAVYRHIAVPTPKGGREFFDCVSLGPGERGFAVLFMFGVAVIILPTFTSFSLGVSARGWRARGFLGVKMALALLAVWFWAEAVAGVAGPGMLPTSLLVGFLVALRWTLDDQRRRCPECLRQVTNPVSFGCLSHTLLDWHGAEFVCPEGHGMLQVSATPASPYAPLHWVRL